MALGFDLFAATCLLGVGWAVISDCEGAMGWSLPGGRAVDDSGGGHRTLPYGPVFEPAESGGVRRHLRCGSDAGEEISAGCVVAGIRGERPSADGRFYIFLLPSPGDSGEI